MAVEFYIHKMSEHMESAEIIQWLVAEGQAVTAHQAIVEVMTDKFAVEVEAPEAGILAGIRPGCGKGAVVPVGEPIAYIAQPGERVPRLTPLGDSTVTEVADMVVAGGGREVESGEAIGRVKSTPVARRMANDLGVDIEQVQGTGPGGRVVEADIRAAAVLHKSQPSEPPAAAAPSVAAPTAPGAGDNGFRFQELTPIQRMTGERMRESVVNAPQFALEMSADATNLLWLQEALADRVALAARTRLSLTGLLIKITAESLLHHPCANAEFAGGRIKLFDAVNIGVAIGTDRGLVVPVIKDAAHKDLATIMAELAAFQEKAGTLHFAAADLAGGTFTLSNLGMYGVERFTAIVNPPQSAILAVGAVTRQPVALANDTLAVRPLISLTLTVDHRVLDGVQAARFLAEIKDRIEKPYFVIG